VSTLFLLKEIIGFCIVKMSLFLACIFIEVALVLTTHIKTTTKQIDSGPYHIHPFVIKCRECLCILFDKANISKFV